MRKYYRKYIKKIDKDLIYTPPKRSTKNPSPINLNLISSSVSSTSILYIVLVVISISLLLEQKDAKSCSPIRHSKLSLILVTSKS